MKHPKVFAAVTRRMDQTVLKMIKECVDVLSPMYDDLCDVSFGCHSLMGDMVTRSWRSGSASFPEVVRVVCGENQLFCMLRSGLEVHCVFFSDKEIGNEECVDKTKGRREWP